MFLCVVCSGYAFTSVSATTRGTGSRDFNPCYIPLGWVEVRPLFLSAAVGRVLAQQRTSGRAVWEELLARGGEPLSVHARYYQNSTLTQATGTHTGTHIQAYTDQARTRLLVSHLTPISSPHPQYGPHVLDSIHHHSQTVPELRHMEVHT